MFQGCCAEDNEKSHPECGTLERDGFVRLVFVCLIVRFKDDGVEEQREKTEDKKQLDAEDDEIFGMMLHANTGLRRNDLINVMQVDAAGKQENQEENSGNLLVVTVERLRDGLDVFFGDGFPKARGDRHDEKRESTDPNHGREQMECVIQNRNQRIEIEENVLKGIHVKSW